MAHAQFAALVWTGLCAVLALPPPEAAAQVPPPAAESATAGSFSYQKQGRTVSLRASPRYVAVRGDTAALTQALAADGLARHVLSDSEALRQRKLTLFGRMQPQPARPAGALVQPFAALREAARRVALETQPVFEQGGALLIPGDEVIVGVPRETTLEAARALLGPVASRLGSGEVRAHRAGSVVVTIERPADGRALAVATELSRLPGVTFAEPNFAVLPLQGREDRSLPPALAEPLRQPRGPASQIGPRSAAPLVGPRQAHASVPWSALIDEDFEGPSLPAGWSTGRWAQDKADAYWAASAQRSHRGTRSIHASSGGPAGVVPPAAYPVNVQSFLETPALDLAPFKEVYIDLWFFARYGMLGAGGTVDGALVYVRDPATGAISTGLDALLGINEVLCQPAGDCSADATTDRGWRRLLVRVRPAARKNGVHVGVMFRSDAAGGAEGLYVDQLRVLGTTNVDTDPIGNDTFGARQYELRNAGQIAGVGSYGNDMAVPEAWAITSIAPQVIVGVVDAGVEQGHPDLNLTTGYEPDGSVGGAPRDPHGTAVAGNVGAIGNNGIGVVGVAPGVRLMPVYMGSSFADIARALDTAVAKGARIVTNSWGWVGAPSSDIEAAVRDALEAGVAVLFAAGNGPDRPPYTYDTAFPCNLTASTDVICIGASSPDDRHKSASSADGQPWWGSSFLGAGPDVVAPGPWSYTTDERGTAGYNDGSLIDPADPASADYTPAFGGTSSATPKAAGVVALMLSANLDLSPAQVKRILRETAEDIAPPGWDDRTGAGRIHAARAVRRAALEPATSRLLHVHAVGHPRLARPGHRDSASLVVAVNSTQGPVQGLDITHFRARAGLVAAGGCEVDITRVVSILPGSYLLDIVPATPNPACVWKVGRYSLAVLVTRGLYAGTGVTDFVVATGGEQLLVRQSNETLGAGVAGVSVMKCPAGHDAIAGGFAFGDAGGNTPRVMIRSSQPGTDENGARVWLVSFRSLASQSTQFGTSVVCLRNP